MQELYPLEEHKKEIRELLQQKPTIFDVLRSKLGGNWYDNWWYAIDERFDPMPEGFGQPTFFDLINKGWLEMYPPKKKTIMEMWMCYE